MSDLKNIVEQSVLDAFRKTNPKLIEAIETILDNGIEPNAVKRMLQTRVPEDQFVFFETVVDQIVQERKEDSK